MTTRSVLTGQFASAIWSRGAQLVAAALAVQPPESEVLGAPYLQSRDAEILIGRHASVSLHTVAKQ